MAKSNGQVTFSNGEKKHFKASSPKRANSIAKDILRNMLLKRDDIKRETEGELQIDQITFGKNRRVIYDRKKLKQRRNRREVHHGQPHGAGKHYLNIGRRRHCQHGQHSLAA